MLITQGEQGTAKSGLSRFLRALIDPSVVALRTTPREERDLIIAARNNHVIAFDNLSGLPPWLSDAFCRLATGGGFSTRQLYTDTEEVLIQVQRPILLNGIDEVATRQDLIDRAIILNLTPIPAARRRPEAELRTLFEQARPRVLGGLLDAVATALRRLPDTHLNEPPRLADFALWATAAETGLGAETGGFLQTYTRNRTDAVETGLDGSPVARALRAFCVQRGHHGTWRGTSIELLNQLADTPGTDGSSSAWPRSDRGLTRQLKRLTAALRTFGIHVRWEKSTDGNRRLIVLDWVFMAAKGAHDPEYASHRAAGLDLSDLSDAPKLSDDNAINNKRFLPKSTVSDKSDNYFRPFSCE